MAPTHPTSTPTTGTLTTGDGHELRADVATVEPGGVDARGAVVICHPHPQYGGNRHHAVVDAVFRALPQHEFHALRFDFRDEFDDGVGERLDVVAALDHLAGRFPGVPRYVVGYSFGAVVALGAAADAASSPVAGIGGIVAIAPPLAMMPVPDPGVPCLVLVPEHDQFCPPSAAVELVAGWNDAEVRSVAMADHFLAGRTAAVATDAVAWLSDRADRR